jgi:katanin p60 ATPase-containing subunit A1
VRASASATACPCSSGCLTFDPTPCCDPTDAGGGGATGAEAERLSLVQKLPYAMDSESYQLAMTISRDVHLSVSGVSFDDVVGLSGAKQLLQEAVVFPVKYPSLFTGLLSPWKGILLYGPPGTGKTMLAKAVAAECRTTFFNISASSIVSKFRGDSEKLVRVLFELARLHAPSTIFMDEIDAILGQRGAHEHEVSGWVGGWVRQ